LQTRQFSAAADRFHDNSKLLVAPSFPARFEGSCVRFDRVQLFYNAALRSM
jgi:hypothetical protein